MQIAYDRSNRVISGIEKVFLTKEERAALQSIINLPAELKMLVDDRKVICDWIEFSDFQITEDGLVVPDLQGPRPIVWLNSPSDCRKHLHNGGLVSLIFRSPKLTTRIPYDFRRVLISKHMGD